MIVVLADDFSGAAEVAGAAFLSGLSAEVHLDQLRESDCDVVVVDTNTRSLPADVASGIVEGVATEVQRSCPSLVYMKIDSLLRGPILAEQLAVCRSLRLARCFLINANPRKGRMVRGGCLFIEGKPVNETCFADDPEHPRRSARVVELLGDTDGLVRVVGVRDALPTTGICVGNAESTADLLQFAERSLDSTLLAGAAEFFEAILATRCNRGTNRLPCSLQLTQHTLVVCGTTVRSNHRSGLMSQLRDSTVVLDDQIDRSARLVCEKLERNGVAAMMHAGELQPPPDKKLSADHALQRIIDAAGIIMPQCEPKSVWIEGGRTASSLIRACGWEKLQVNAVYADGVVGLRVHAANAPTVVVKPGSYPWPVTDRCTEPIVEVE